MIRLGTCIWMLGLFGSTLASLHSLPAQIVDADSGRGSLTDLTTGIGWHTDNRIFRAASQDEGPLEVFLGEARFESELLFTEERFPNVVVGIDGTVIAAWNRGMIRRSTDGGATWEEVRQIADGFMGGGYLVDEVSGDVLAFLEEHHPPAKL